MNLHAPSRRELLLASGVLFAWAYAPKLARAEGRDPRFLAIILRGALDGLAAVAPVGDPDWPKLRGDKALALDGATPALPLDGFFALNPAMPVFARLFKAGQAAVVHADAALQQGQCSFGRLGVVRIAGLRASADAQTLLHGANRIPGHRSGPHMLRRYWPPTSNSAFVICPSEHTRTACISTSKTLALAITACCKRFTIGPDSAAWRS